MCFLVFGCLFLFAEMDGFAFGKKGRWMCKGKLLSYPTLLSHISHSGGLVHFSLLMRRWMLLSWSGNTFVSLVYVLGFSILRVGGRDTIF